MLSGENLSENSITEIYERLKEQKWLIIMVGVPGSGKTTFSAPLAQKLGAYRLNMDLLRKELFGTANRREQLAYDRTQTAGLSREEERRWYTQTNNQTRQAYWEHLETNLAAGRSVVVDSSSDSRKKRDKLLQTAKRLGASPIVVWTQVPYAVAIERATCRELSSDSYPFEEEHLAREEIDRCLGDLDLPTEEHLITIDGQDNLAGQLTSFAAYAAEQAQ